MTLYWPVILRGYEKPEWPQLYLPTYSQNAIAGLLCKPENSSLWNAKEPQALPNEVRYLILSEKHADQDKLCREKSKEFQTSVSKGWYSSQSRQSIVESFIFYPQKCFCSKQKIFYLQWGQFSHFAILGPEGNGFVEDKLNQTCWAWYKPVSQDYNLKTQLRKEESCDSTPRYKY